MRPKIIRRKLRLANKHCANFNHCTLNELKQAREEIAKKFGKAFQKCSCMVAYYGRLHQHICHAIRTKMAIRKRVKEPQFHENPSATLPSP